MIDRAKTRQGCTIHATWHCVCISNLTLVQYEQATFSRVGWKFFKRGGGLLLRTRFFSIDRSILAHPGSILPKRSSGARAEEESPAQSRKKGPPSTLCGPDGRPQTLAQVPSNQGARGSLPWARGTTRVSLSYVPLALACLRAPDEGNALFLKLPFLLSYFRTWTAPPAPHSGHPAFDPSNGAGGSTPAAGAPHGPPAQLDFRSVSGPMHRHSTSC